MIDRRGFLCSVAAAAATTSLPAFAREAQYDTVSYATGDDRYFAGDVTDHGFAFR